MPDSNIVDSNIIGVLTMRRLPMTPATVKPLATQPSTAAGTVGHGWRWWIAAGAPVIESRVFSGEAIALIGDKLDGLVAWAEAIDRARPVFDLQGGRRLPSVQAVRRAFAASPMPIVIANRSERVTSGLGAAIQPYFVWTAPLSSRPGESVALLEAAMTESAGRPIGLADLGWRGDILRAYQWRGLGEIRRTSHLLAALAIERGNVTRAAARVGVSRQAFQRRLARRMGLAPVMGEE